MSRVQMTKVLN